MYNFVGCVCVTKPGGDAAHVSAGQLAAGLAGPHQPAVAGHRAHARTHRLAQPAERALFSHHSYNPLDT